MFWQTQKITTTRSSSTRFLGTRRLGLSCQCAFEFESVYGLDLWSRKRRDWKVDKSSYTGAFHEGLGGLVSRAEDTKDPILHATLANNEAC